MRASHPLVKAAESAAAASSGVSAVRSGTGVVGCVIQTGGDFCLMCERADSTACLQCQWFQARSAVSAVNTGSVVVAAVPVYIPTQLGHCRYI